MLNFACLDQIFDSTSSFLNGRVGIDAVLVEQVNGIRLQTLQRAFDDLLYVLGATIGCCPLAIVAGIGLESELGSNHDIFAEGSESFAHDLFIDERAIHFGSVEEGDTALLRRSDRSLDSGHLEHGLWQTSTFERQLRGGFFNLLEVNLRQLDIDRSNVLFHP